MEIGILLNLIDDLIKEEERVKTNTDLNNLKTYLTQSKSNNATAKANIDKTIKKLTKNSGSSLANELNTTDSKSLKEINGSNLIGNEFQDRINKIFEEHKYSIDSLIAEIEKIRLERVSFFEKIKVTHTSLKGIGLKEYYNTEDLYEVGIIIPEGDLKFAPEVEKIIHNWNFIVKTISELVNNDFSDIKIHRVNNGCIELFFFEAFEVVKIIGGAITSLVGVYESIKKVRKYAKGLKEEGIKDKTVKEIEKQEAELLTSNMDKLVEELMKESTIKDKGRENEIRTALKKSLTYIAKSIDKGVQIELIPPYVPAKEDIKEDDSAEDKKKKEATNKSLDQMEEKVDTIRSFGSGLKQVANLGESVFKLLPGGDEKLN